MPRIKIDLPADFNFSTIIPVRITDINYGGHVGNDAILSLLHEARLQFLRHLGYSELEFSGVGLIMADVAIEFKSELFYGDTLIASVTPGELGKVGFDVIYRLEKEKAKGDPAKVIVALAKTGMVCYDYAAKKIVAIPARARAALGKEA
jgi:acyl-CoA thioester hydrolase